MGKIKNNVVTMGFSGRFGDDITFRQVDGKTIFAKRRVVTSEPTEKQKDARNKFSEASQIAALALENQEARLDYQAMAVLQGLKSAYMAALVDYLNAPEFDTVSMVNYKGRIGDLISMTSKAVGKLIEIDVSILRPDGIVLEKGKATERNLRWRYITTAVNTQVQGTKFIIVGRDRQGREVNFEKIL